MGNLYKAISSPLQVSHSLGKAAICSLRVRRSSDGFASGNRDRARSRIASNAGLTDSQADRVAKAQLPLELEK